MNSSAVNIQYVVKTNREDHTLLSYLMAKWNISASCTEVHEAEMFTEDATEDICC